MKKLQADVVVIGGGSTGVGVVRDAAMRGYSAVLVERADLGQGTTGRFHGLLHSGGRYVVSDPKSASECAAENKILRRIQPEAIEETGGFFINFAGDDELFPERFAAGAKNCGVEFAGISSANVLKREPALNPKINRAFEVSDASVDGWQLVWSAARSAREYGATILSYHEVTKITRSQEHVDTVICQNRKTGELVHINCNFVLNCAGVWAGQVSAMADCKPVAVIAGRGIMIAMNHRLVGHVINRCSYPADGDILVPAHTVAIIGTTDVHENDPDHLKIPADEVQQMLDAGEQMIPGLRKFRAIHAWAGARPLIKDDRVTKDDTRHMSRGMAIIDHSKYDGLAGFLTICGGKLTTYRLMAEHIVDAMENQLGTHHDCRTADEAVPVKTAKTYHVTSRLADREANWQKEQMLCECELVTRSAFTSLASQQPDASLDDLRRQLRIGMGPCQAGICASRYAGVVCEEKIVDEQKATAMLKKFLENRWIGLAPIMYGDQGRQAALDYWILMGTLNIEHLPGSDRRVL